MDVLRQEAFSGCGSGDPFVGINICQFPVIVRMDEIIVAVLAE